MAPQWNVTVTYEKQHANAGGQSFWSERRVHERQREQESANLINEWILGGGGGERNRRISMSQHRLFRASPLRNVFARASGRSEKRDPFSCLFALFDGIKAFRLVYGHGLQVKWGRKLDRVGVVSGGLLGRFVDFLWLSWQGELCLILEDASV